MLQSQYFNSKLTKDQIDKILLNYNIKYNTMKNEIDAKFNTMIKLFINDIRPFLENIEEIVSERKKLKDLENREREIEILRGELNEKINNEHKMKYDLDTLKKENSDLRTKIKNKRKNVTFKLNKSKEKNYSDSNKNGVKIEGSKSFLKSPYKTFSRINSIHNKPKKNIYKKTVSFAIKEDKRTLKKVNMKTIERHIYRKNCIGNIIPKQKIKSGSVEKKKVFNQHLLTDSPINKARKKFNLSQTKNNNNNNNNKKSILKKTSLKVDTKMENIISDDNMEVEKEIDNDYETINIETNNQKSEFDFKFTEESDSMNEDVIEEEIKELEMDEENIKKLIENIKDFQNDIENGNVY